MLTLVLVASLAATPVKVGVPGFTAVGVDSQLVDAWSEHFITLLGRDGALALTTQRDIAQVLGLERQKELLGCTSTGTSCLAELAGALGVDAVLSASIAKSGSSYTATIRVLRAKDGQAIASMTDRLRSEDALQDWLDAQAPELERAVLAAFPRASGPVATTQPERPVNVRKWLPAAGGLVLGGLGVGAWAVSSSLKTRLTTLDPPFKDAGEARATASTGQVLETSGIVAGAVGGAALIGGVVWALLQKDETPAAVSVTPVPGGAVAVVGGVF